MEEKRLLFSDFVTPGQAYHAAMATIPSDGLQNVRRHGHDFFEWMVVLDGSVLHWVNGEESVLREGQLTLIRPDDIHSIRPDGDNVVRFVNIAFPVSVWQDFACATGVLDEARAWESAAMPLTADLLPLRRQLVEDEAVNALRRFHRNPTRLAFGRFWNAVIEALTDPSSGGDKSNATPAWLRDLLEKTRSEDISAMTLERLAESSGVSFGHLCRTMKSCLGITPTQYISQLRINRASYELATTDRDIAAIAFDCGFENLSYFYRRFQQMHNKSPRRYRLEARRSLSV